MTYIVRLGVDDRNFWATIQAATGWFAVKAEPARATAEA